MKILDFLLHQAIDPQSQLPALPSLSHWEPALRRQWNKASHWMLVAWNQEACPIGEKMGERCEDPNSPELKFYRGETTAEALEALLDVGEGPRLPFYQLHLFGAHEPLLFSDMYGGHLVIWAEDDEVEAIREEMEPHEAYRDVLISEIPETVDVNKAEMDMLAAELERLLAEFGEEGLYHEEPGETQ